MTNYYNYYLVALNLEDGKIVPRIINLDNTILKEEDEKELTNLAYVDNLTAKYDEETFRRYLFDKGVLKDLNTPVFVVRHSRSSEMDKTGHRKPKASVKFFCPIFKSNDSSLINNLALTTIRQRSLTVSDASYLLKYFEDLFYSSDEFRHIASYIINEHDLKHVLNYEYYMKTKKTNPIKYSLLRDVVSTLYEFEKNKTYERFMLKVYAREDFIPEVLTILPKKITIRKANLKPVVRQTIEQAEELKHTKLDNEAIKQQQETGTFKDRDVRTLTLEDQLRVGLIGPIEYINARETNEVRFRK